MNKFTLFTLLLSVTVMSVMAELLANDYVDVGVNANVLQQPSEKVEAGGVLFELENQESVKAAAAENEKVPKVKRRDLLPTNNQTTGEKPSEVQMNLPQNSVLSEMKMREAGFFDPHVAPIAPNFAVFGVFPVPRDKYEVELIQAQILEDNTSVGILQEFSLTDSLAAQSFYRFIKDQGEKANYFEVNEVMNYGDMSLYLNHAVRKDQVFLIVAKGSRVWALTYVNHLHPKFRSLIESMT